jgi:hypothetical protein
MVLRTNEWESEDPLKSLDLLTEKIVSLNLYE